MLVSFKQSASCVPNQVFIQVTKPSTDCMDYKRNKGLSPGTASPAWSGQSVRYWCFVVTLQCQDESKYYDKASVSDDLGG